MKNKDEVNAGTAPAAMLKYIAEETPGYAIRLRYAVGVMRRKGGHLWEANRELASDIQDRMDMWCDRNEDCSDLYDIEEVLGIKYLTTTTKNNDNMEEKEMTAVDAAVAAARRAIKDAILSGELAAEYSPCAIGEAHTRIVVKICGKYHEMWLGDSYLTSSSEFLKDAFSDFDDFEALRKMAAAHVAPPSKETMERMRKVQESITEMMNSALGGLGDLCVEKERIRNGGAL